MQMEVGIEDCLHIEFEYDKSRYHLSDTVVGKIYFLLVRIKLKHMEVCALQQLSRVLPACSAIELASKHLYTQSVHRSQRLTGCWWSSWVQKGPHRTAAHDPTATCITASASHSESPPVAD